MKRSRMPRRNAERKAKSYIEEFAGPFVDYDHRAQIATMVCANSSRLARKYHHGMAFDRTDDRWVDPEAAHVIKRSQGGCWYDITPLCSMCHRVFEIDCFNDPDLFLERFGVDLRKLADGLAEKARRECEVDPDYEYCLRPGWQKLPPGGNRPKGTRTEVSK